MSAASAFNLELFNIANLLNKLYRVSDYLLIQRNIYPIYPIPLLTSTKNSTGRKPEPQPLISSYAKFQKSKLVNCHNDRFIESYKDSTSFTVMVNVLTKTKTKNHDSVNILWLILGTKKELLVYF